MRFKLVSETTAGEVYRSNRDGTDPTPDPAPAIDVDEDAVTTTDPRPFILPFLSRSAFIASDACCCCCCACFSFTTPQSKWKSGTCTSNDSSSDSSFRSSNADRVATSGWRMADGIADGVALWAVKDVLQDRQDVTTGDY